MIDDGTAKIADCDPEEDAELYEVDLRRLRRQFSKSLERQGVEWPAGNLAIGLVLLHRHMAKAVNKNDVAEYVRIVKGDVGISGDQQLRHLRPLGWYVVGSGRGHYTTNHDHLGNRIPKGHYMLVSVSAPHPLWAAERRMTRAGGRLNARDFLDLQVLYGFRCASCGRELPDGADQGHMDPRKPLDIGNTIPLCPSCNNWQGDRLVLGEDGRVKALASPDLVLKSDEPVQLAILDELLGKFGVRDAKLLAKLRRMAKK